MSEEKTGESTKKNYEVADAHIRPIVISVTVLAGIAWTPCF